MKKYITEESAITAINIAAIENVADANHNYAKGFRDAAEAIRNAPAADVRPIIPARWVSVPHKRARICSNCFCDEPYKFAEEDADVYDFCPHCGYVMNEKRRVKLKNADVFQKAFGFYATEMWSKSENEFLEWLNSEWSDGKKESSYEQF